MMSCGSKKRIFLGIDTSCYTTSAACVCVNENSAEIVCDERTLLKVAAGERGLRQSDAVFQHVRNLAEILPKIFKQIDRKDVAGVGVSVCPSGREGSYMPVFLAGKSHALSVSAALGVPVYEFTHQQGHIRAAAFDNESLLGKDFFAFHLSGGTSELLRIDSSLSDIKKIGGTTDINAGQLVDRLGVAMGLRFPAGKELEKIAAEALKNKSYADSGFVLPSSVKSLSCSFSGVETKAANALKNGENHGTVAAAVYDCIARTLAKLVKNAIEFETENAAREVSVDSKCRIGDETASTKSFLFAGGVASSTILREMLADRLHKTPVELHFSRPVLSSDNAVGIAALAAEEDAFNGRTVMSSGT